MGNVVGLPRGLIASRPPRGFQSISSATSTRRQESSSRACWYCRYRHAESRCRLAIIFKVIPAAVISRPLARITPNVPSAPIPSVMPASPSGLCGRADGACRTTRANWIVNAQRSLKRALRVRVLWTRPRSQRAGCAASCVSSMRRLARREKRACPFVRRMETPAWTSACARSERCSAPLTPSESGLMAQGRLKDGARRRKTRG